MKIALIRGPYLRPNGVVPWERLHQKTHHDVVGFESGPARFETKNIDFPVRQLSWPDGKIDAFGHDHIISKGLRRLRIPSDYLRGVSSLTDEFDVLHTTENFNIFSFQAAVATRGTDATFVFAQGENIPYPLFQRNPLMWQMKQYVNRRAAGVTTTTPKGKRALIHEGVDHERITVVPNSVDAGMFHSSPPVDPTDIGLPERLKNTLTIVFVHGLCEQKGTPYLIEAFNQLCESHDDISLLLLGQNDLSPIAVEKLESNPAIIWKEHVPYQRMPEIYNLSDISVLPSVTMVNNEEQFGMAVLEAMACELPTIVTDVGGLSYVAEEHSTSLVVEERDAESLRTAIDQLIESPNVREEMGKNGRERAVTTFSPETVCERLVEFYDNLPNR